jgi:threonine aldolase
MDRLAVDHENARLLAEGLSEIDGLDVDQAVQTNMVFVGLESNRAEKLTAFLKKRGIFVAGRERLRLVTHLDVTREDMGIVAGAVKEYFLGKE